jgi:hypothetical protein
VQPYCTHEGARLPLLFVDGSVLVKSTAEANRGWIPNSPTAGPSTFQYQPDIWEPAPVSGTVDWVEGRFRWTRGTTTAGGIAGRDFGGPETCSGQQPGCP